MKNNYAHLYFCVWATNPQHGESWHGTLQGFLSLFPVIPCHNLHFASLPYNPLQSSLFGHSMLLRSPFNSPCKNPLLFGTPCNSRPHILSSPFFVTLPPTGATTHSSPTPRASHTYIAMASLLQSLSCLDRDGRVSRNTGPFLAPRQAFNYSAMTSPLVNKLPADRASPRLRTLVNNAHRQLLSNNSDVTIDPLSLWHAIYRHHYQCLPPPLYTPGISNHNALYFFNRDPQRGQESPNSFT